METQGSRCIYLQARIHDEPAWLSVKGMLEEAGYQVKPERLARASNELGAMQEARRQRIADLRAAHSLVFLRTTDDEASELAIRAAAIDRADLQAFCGKDLPCAVIDQVGGELTIADALNFKRIDARHRSWLLHLEAWLTTTIRPTIKVGP